MSEVPLVRCAGALVIFDGLRRIIWNQISPSRWRPSRLWPDPAEAAEVGEAVRRGEPVLIVLDRRPEPVHILTEELAAAPPEVAALVTSVAGEVAQLDIPRLQWLPEYLAERGQRFLQDVAVMVAHTPALLLPVLILQPPEGAEAVWFGLRVRSASWSIDELMAVADHLMRERRRAA